MNPHPIGVITGMQQAPRPSLDAVKEMGIETVHLQFPAHLNNAAGIAAIRAAVDETKIIITTVFCGFEGESYADIPTVQRTVGFLPPHTRRARVALVDEIADFAQKLGVSRVAAHIGFIPEDVESSIYGELVSAVRGVCQSLQNRGQVFALETGQESARALARFIADVDVPNLRVNFDPANMVLYGIENPLEALPILAPWIDGVHCKDGLWPTQSGQLGREVPFGEGDIDAREWLRNLLQSGYVGPLTIEREISGDSQKRDIVAAKTLVDEALREFSFVDEN